MVNGTFKVLKYVINIIRKILQLQYKSKLFINNLKKRYKKITDLQNLNLNEQSTYCD